MLIELSKYKVEFKKELTFGDMEDIQSQMQTATDILKGNSKLLEVSIISITEIETGNAVIYSDEWRRNLSIKDGVKVTTEAQKLIEGLDELVKKG
jgi:hypothetical protein